MQPDAHAGKEWAIFIRPVAHRDQVAEIDFADILFQVLGYVPAQVDAALFHHLDGERVDPFGLETGAEGFEALPAIATQERLRHLAAGGVPRAQEQAVSNRLLTPLDDFQINYIINHAGRHILKIYPKMGGMGCFRCTTTLLPSGIPG
jgi:hypothetical protein